MAKGMSRTEKAAFSAGCRVGAINARRSRSTKGTTRRTTTRRSYY